MTGMELLASDILTCLCSFPLTTTSTLILALKIYLNMDVSTGL